MDMVCTYIWVLMFFFKTFLNISFLSKNETKQVLKAWSFSQNTVFISG